MNRIIIIIILLFAQSIWAKTFVYTAPMVCQDCADSIKGAVKKVRKIKSYKANPETDIVEVSFSDKDEPFTEKELKDIDWEAGYQLKLKEVK